MVAEVVPSAGTKRSFAAFVATSADGLRREVRADARRRGLPADVDVDDVVQTAFVKLLPVYERLDTEFAAFNYAHKSAMRALSDLRRRERVRHEGWLETVYRRTQRAVPDPEEEALRELRAADVRAALGRLPDSQRRAVALVDVEDLQQAEAAHVMGVSATVVKGLVQRGRESLRRDLREVCGIAALFRLRRPSVLAPAVTAPGVLAMAFVLTVVHAPAVPAPAPAPYAVQAVAPATTAAPAVTRPVAGPRAVAPVARPRAERPARPVAPQPVAPQPAPPPFHPDLPHACLPGILCEEAPKAGDRLCVAGPEGDSCVTQDRVGVCPVAAHLNPVVKCTRNSRPAIDPTPPAAP